MQRVPLDAEVPPATLVTSTVYPETSQVITETYMYVDNPNLYVYEVADGVRCGPGTDLPYHDRPNPYVFPASLVQQCRDACLDRLDCDSFSFGSGGCRLSNYRCYEGSNLALSNYLELGPGKCVGSTRTVSGIQECVQICNSYLDYNFFSMNDDYTQCVVALHCTYKVYNEPDTFEDVSGWTRYITHHKPASGNKVYRVDRRVQTTPDHMAVPLAAGYEYVAEKVVDHICHDGWGMIVYAGETGDNPGTESEKRDNCLARCVGGTEDTGTSPYRWSDFSKNNAGFSGITGFFTSNGRCYCIFRRCGVVRVYIHHTLRTGSWRNVSDAQRSGVRFPSTISSWTAYRASTQIVS